MAHTLLKPEKPDRKPGLLERLGVRYYRRRLAYDRKLGVGYTDEAASRLLTRHARWFGIAAFVIGGISAAGAAYVSFRYYDKPEFFWEGNLVLAIVTVGLSAIEFVVLFWLALDLVYRVVRVSGQDLLAEDPVYTPDVFASLIARAALEVPDPVLHYLDLDPLARVPKSRLWLVAILYKLKIAASSVFARLILTRVIGKAVVRGFAYFISIPITGFWNAWTLYKVSADARLRVFGNRVATHVANQLATFHAAVPISEAGQLAIFEAVGNTVVLTQNYHPNMVLLLVRLREVFPDLKHGRLDDWETFVVHLKQLHATEQQLVRNLLVVSAAFDGQFSALERKELPDAFGDQMKLYASRIEALRRHLARGRFHAAIALADLAFQP